MALTGNTTNLGTAAINSVNSYMNNPATGKGFGYTPVASKPVSNTPNNFQATIFNPSWWNNLWAKPTTPVNNIGMMNGPQGQEIQATNPGQVETGPTVSQMNATYASNNSAASTPAFLAYLNGTPYTDVNAYNSAVGTENFGNSLGGYSNNMNTINSNEANLNSQNKTNISNLNANRDANYLNNDQYFGSLGDTLQTPQQGIYKGKITDQYNTDYNNAQDQYNQALDAQEAQKTALKKTSQSILDNYMNGLVQKDSSGNVIGQSKPSAAVSKILKTVKNGQLSAYQARALARAK